MAIDPYRLCPCGSGKKVKFCCSKDILSDLDQVLRAIEGEQYLAALDQVGKLIHTKGARPALLNLKASLELSKGHEEAEKTLEQLVKAAPHQPGTLSLMSLLEVRRGNLDEAVDLLQQAMEYVENAIPPSLYTALSTLAQALLGSGDILAVRGHLSLAAALSQGEDERPLALLMAVDRAPEISPLLKEDFGLSEAPAGVPWEGEFKAALNPARGGTWRAAAENLLSLSDKAPNQPAILRNIAILHGWLGRAQKAAEMWHRYAALADVPLDDAVEAEALAQVVDETQVDLVEHLNFTYPVNDLERLMERLLSDRRVARAPVDPRELAREGQPPPRGVFLLLDRPAAATRSAEMPWHEIPQILGVISTYGKETDREARLEVSLDRVPELDARKVLVADIAGEWVGAPGIEKVDSDMSLLEWLTTPRLHFSEDMSPQQVADAFREYHRDAVLRRWPDIPSAVLDGKRPREVAGDPSYRVRLLAKIMLMELASHLPDADLYQALRRDLQLPASEAFDPSGLDIGSLSLPKLMRLDVPRLSDEQLVAALQRAVLKGLRSIEHRMGIEALTRTSLESKIDQNAVYQVVVRTSPDSDTSLHWIDTARRAAESRRLSPAPWLLAEFSARIARGEAEEANRILSVLRTRHAGEPGVAESLKQILERFGLLGPAPPGTRPPAAEAPPTAVPEPKKIWTPDQPSAPSPAATGQSKLWVPGAD